MKVKKILINSENDYKKLLHKINLYKSILYRNIYFNIQNNTENKDIKDIETALNIKKRIQRITYIYDRSCEIIDEQTKGLNICGFKDGQCYIQRKLNNGKCNGCCRRCKYQTSNGCPTKNLACKLFNCSEVKARFNVISDKDLSLLKLLSLKNRLIVKSDYFSKREDVLKDLYSYSIIYATLRITWRLINNLGIKK